MLITAIISIVSFLGILLALVFAHEFGHFITAKMARVKVEEFGIGFPPKLFSFKRGETVYSLNAIPLGGFTKLVGEEDPSTPGSLASKSIPVRFLVLTAGSLMNIILPIFLLTMSYLIPHDIMQEKVLIKDVATGSPAQIAGIEPGDTVLKINNRKVINRADVSYLIHLNLGSEVNILIQKQDQSLKVIAVKPRWNPPAGQGAIGIAITGMESTKIRESYPAWEALPLGIRHCWEILVLFRNEVTSWFVRQTAPQLTGPVGIATITGEVAKGGISPLLAFAALISINLAVINLFPFPGLDGGRLVFLFIEWIRHGKRISPKKEGLVHLIGLITLILLIVAISYFDIMRIIQGENLVP
ncbi:MAG: RIP metalloprotease RseP [Chloroflexi bacterium]|nr:RIP metalloprotease RseP [Chloroflexota bacterium]MBM3174637.1 RIP metalloprotease RseP [Chloroflexota bacterium]